MNNLMIFENKPVEVFDFNGQVLFNPYHCGDCLDLTESAVRNHLSKMNEKQAIILTNSNVRDKDIRKLHNTGEKFLTESGVYKLIFKSHKPDAEKFQDWVTDEVLPAIRKHGAYMTESKIEEVLLNPDTIINLAMQLKEERETKRRLSLQILEDKPKVVFADSVAASEDTMLVGELAKIIKQNGTNIGQNRMFAWLREHGYLVKRRGTDYNMPTQKSMSMELFVIKETAISHSDGHVTVNRTPKVTGKGQIYFVNKFRNSQYEKTS